MLTLHYWPDSASMVVRMALLETGTPHQLVLIDRAGGALDSDAYRALHPLGKIPALETPDGPMFETAAILLWLADRHPGAGLAPAPDAPERGTFLTWLFFMAFNLHPAMLDLHYPDRVAGPAASPAVLAHARQRLLTFVAVLEATPPRAPLLALYLGMMLRWLGQFPPDHPGHLRLADYPALQALLAQAETRASVQAVARDEDLGPHPFTRPA